MMEQSMLVTIQDFSLPEIKARVTLCNHLKNRDTQMYKDGLMNLILYIEDYEGIMRSYYGEKSILCIIDEKDYLSLDEKLVEEFTKLYQKGSVYDVVRKLINLCGMDPSKITKEMEEDLDYLRFKKNYIRDYNNGEEEGLNEEQCKRFYEDHKKRILLGDGDMNHDLKEYDLEEVLEGL